MVSIKFSLESIECLLDNFSGCWFGGIELFSFLVYLEVFFALFFYYCITSGDYDSMLNIEIVILEFIDKRPFKETEYMKKEQILQDMLYNVNNQVNRRRVLITDTLVQRACFWSITLISHNLKRNI